MSNMGSQIRYHWSLSVSAYNPRSHPIGGTMRANYKLMAVRIAGAVALLGALFAANARPTVKAAPTGLVGTPSFLPMLMRVDPPTATNTPVPTDTPTATPTTPPPEAIPGVNVQCQTNGAVEICASVSDANPSQHSTVTVYGRLVINQTGQGSQAMGATWHYKTTTPSCGGTTDPGGVGSCSRDIGSATHGYQVNIDVSIGGYQVTTWFTPQ